MKISSLNLAKNYNLSAGTLDSLTGTILIYNPALILYVMGLDAPTENVVFLKYVGVFVLSTGASYFIPSFHRVIGISYQILSLTIWITTSLTRLLVSAFVFIKILQGELSLPWAVVGLSDLSLAVFQVYLFQIYRDEQYE